MIPNDGSTASSSNHDDQSDSRYIPRLVHERKRSKRSKRKRKRK